MDKAEFMKMVSQHWDEVERLNESKSMYELEERVYKVVQRLGQELMEKQMEVRNTMDRRKKKA